MWHDICVANRDALVQVLRAFNEDLHRLSEAVEKGDSEFLKETFTRAKAARDRFCQS
jgi:prephenate dehydrogenase